MRVFAQVLDNSIRIDFVDVDQDHGKEAICCNRRGVRANFSEMKDLLHMNDRLKMRGPQHAITQWDLPTVCDEPKLCFPTQNNFP